MARPVSRLELTASERQELERRVKAPSASQRDSLRAAIILRRAQGIKQVQVAAELGVSVACVNKWSQCFDREGLAGLADAKGRGRPASLPADKVEQILTAVTQPPKPRTRWSVRSMVQAAGMSPDSVHRIWKANDLKPHLTKTFKVSTDPHFEEKFWDVIGLYLDPPERALVLCGSPSWSGNWPAARGGPAAVPGPPRRNRALPPRLAPTPPDADPRGARRADSPKPYRGHEGHGRSWVSVEQVDERIPVKPSNCHRCGHRLTGDDPHPQRHQEVVVSRRCGPRSSSISCTPCAALTATA